MSAEEELYNWVPDGAAANGQQEAVGTQVDIRNVCYSVFINGEEKKLLQNINFHLEPGDMCALMGASGAGKSTLLDLIAARKEVGAWGGDILINQRPRSLFFNRDSAYVLQDDVHIATLTVEETIKYAAWTRMPEGTSASSRDARVRFLLDMLGISHVKDSLVGDPMHKGISGGQLKRLSIGVEIVHLPNLIFLDEPTSGLDSAIALEVMGAVRKLADQNRTCMSTIHQPSPEVFSLFDKAVLLSKGRLLYAGPADEAVAHFTRPALGYKYDPDQNPAEFIIDVCGGLVNPEGSEFPRLPEELEELYKQSEFCVPPADQLTVELPPAEFTRRHATTRSTQFKMLIERGWVSLVRDKADTRAGMAKNIIVGVLIGVVFYDQGNLPKDTEFFPISVSPTGEVTQSEQMSGETSTLTSIFFFTMMYCLMSNLQAIPALCTRDIVYRRDLASFGYSASSYWAACMISNLPMVLTTHTLYIVSVFFLLGLEPTFAYFCFYYFLLLLTNLTSYYFALFLAAGTGSAQLAFAVFPLTFLFFSMFAGFTIPVDKVPPAWSWAPFISYARWVFQGLMVNEFDLYDNGDDVLTYYAFNGYSAGNSFWIVILFMLLTQTLSYLAMRPAASKLVRFEEMKNRPVSKKANDSDNLKEKLLDSAGSSGTEDPYAIAFPTRSTYDVAWYRQNTGDVQLSRGCRLVFRNLVYTVVNKQNNKVKIQLLKGVSGRAHPGEMCALMGASGAGKSTLLDVIAGRKTTGEISGDILFNGGEVTPAVMRSSAYVMQDNVHIGVLTVRQTMTYAAELRMPQKVDHKIRVARVNKILDMLGLAEHAGTLVGNENIRGISGGQLKRLSIGVEIVNLPDLIFLDEPTSGLDSSISYEVMAAVRNLANQNRTVICTIHQPSPITYFLFDKLLLMAEGRVIYFGPARDVVNYFSSSVYKFPYIRGTNPADFVISVAGSFTPSHDGKIIGGGELATYYAQSDLCRVFMENIDTMVAMDLAAVGEPSQDDEALSLYPTSTAWQLKVLLHRLVIKTGKERKPTIASFGRHIIVGLFYGTIFYNLDDTQFTERLSVFFFGLMFMILGHQQAIPALFEDRLVFYRERGAHCYGALPYWVTLWILQVPFAMINVLVFACITYTMCGFTTAEGHFGPYYCALLFCSWTGLFLCQLIASLAPTGQAAINIFPVSLFAAVIFAGYIIFIPEFPTWLEAWGPYVSFMRFGFQAMVLNELVGNPDLSAYSNQFIEDLGFDDFSREECLSIIPVFFLTFCFGILLALKYVNWEER
jgi:ABC-type multidrug transport system ATPase subunit